MPVTHRNLSRSFAVVTGHLAEDSEHGPDWNALARIDTLVVLMGLRKVKEVTHNLLAAGRAAGHAGHDRRRRHAAAPADGTATLETLPAAAAQAGLPPDAPATLVIGEVVGLATGARSDHCRSRLRWICRSWPGRYRLNLIRMIQGLRMIARRRRRNHGNPLILRIEGSD